MKKVLKVIRQYFRDLFVYDCTSARYSQEFREEENKKRNLKEKE